MSKRHGNWKKLREEEQAIGETYKQYIDTFQETSDIPSKVFVRSATLYPERGFKAATDKGALYKPKPIIKLSYKEENSPKLPLNPLLKSKRESKSNLKALGDELKMLQHERQTKEKTPKIFEAPAVSYFNNTSLENDSDHLNSTNLFISNLHPQISESYLIDLFGPFGPLASVKIMWPRGEDATKSSNCGFVAFMSRSDAERAMHSLKSRDDMRISWGKAVKVPFYPVHIPPELYKLYSPPPQSGLPFNAQIIGTELTDIAETLVKVTIPLDRNVLLLIHRMIEFVIREGPKFEAAIMTKEAVNPDFEFLWNFQSPTHTYYRWKLYSMLNGELKNSWSLKPFRMFVGGSIWIPPIPHDYKNGMPKQLIAKTTEQLSLAQSNRLNQIIKNLNVSKTSVMDAMVFCLNHTSAIDDIIEILIDSLKNTETHPLKKIARFYLLSDILFNCKTKEVRVVQFDDEQESVLCIFKEFYLKYKALKFTNDKENFKSKVLKVLRSWAFHKLYSNKFIVKMENTFFYGSETGEDLDDSSYDEPLDGASLLKRSYQTALSDCTVVIEAEARCYLVK